MVSGSVPVLSDNLPKQVTPGAPQACFLTVLTAVYQQISQAQGHIPELGIWLLNPVSKKLIKVLAQHHLN
jgi:hypothetical protein